MQVAHEILCMGKAFGYSEIFRLFSLLKISIGKSGHTHMHPTLRSIRLQKHARPFRRIKAMPSLRSTPIVLTPTFRSHSTLHWGYQGKQKDVAQHNYPYKEKTEKKKALQLAGGGKKQGSAAVYGGLISAWLNSEMDLVFKCAVGSGNAPNFAFHFLMFDSHNSLKETEGPVYFRMRDI